MKKESARIKIIKYLEDNCGLYFRPEEIPYSVVGVNPMTVSRILRRMLSDNHPSLEFKECGDSRWRAWRIFSPNAQGRLV